MSIFSEMNLLVNLRFMLMIFVYFISSLLRQNYALSVENATLRPYASQWSGGCYEDCGYLYDAFCEGEPIKMCFDCRMYCLEEETYYSAQDCGSKCPAYLATLTTTGLSWKLLLGYVTAGVVGLLLIIVCTALVIKCLLKNKVTETHQPQQTDKPEHPTEPFL